MRYAVLTDVHANWQALQAVISDLEQDEIDGYWYLGDLIGYGPQPRECLRCFQELEADRRLVHWLVGNHDVGLIEPVVASMFHSDASRVLEMHKQLLEAEPELWAWCKVQMSVSSRHQPLSTLFGDVVYVLTHACLIPGEYIGRSPTSYLFPWKREWVRWNGLVPLHQHYLGSHQHACLVYGHTHFPAFWSLPANYTHRSHPRLHSIVYNRPLSLRYGLVAFNPGSVGQPRDGDGRAAFAVVDTSQATVEFRRTPYRSHVTLSLMARDAYPLKLQERIGNPNLLSEERENFRLVYQPTETGLEPVDPRDMPDAAAPSADNRW